MVLISENTIAEGTAYVSLDVLGENETLSSSKQSLRDAIVAILSK